MKLVKIIDNPIYWLCGRQAIKDRVSLDIMILRYSYRFFFPNIFSSDDLSRLFRDLFSLYVDALDAAYARYEGIEDRYAQPTKRFNTVYIHLSGIIIYITNSHKFRIKKITSLHEYPEFTYSDLNSIHSWSKQRPQFIKQLSLAERDVLLSSKYSKKQQQYFSAVRSIVSGEIAKHLRYRKKIGAISISVSKLPKKYRWVNDKTYQLSQTVKISFTKVTGSPCRVFKRLVEADGDWVSRDDILAIINKSKDSLRSVISDIRKTIMKSGATNELVVLNDKNGHYRLAKI